MRWRNIIFLALFALVSFSEGRAQSGLRVETLAKAQGVVWGFDFLPTGDIVFTERSGAMRVFSPKTKEIREVKLPFASKEVGQGGLLDVRVGPNFKKDQRLFWTYTKEMPEGYTTALASGRLEGGHILEARDLLVMAQASPENVHFGSRIEFDLKGHIFVSMGDRNARGRSQNLAHHNGKILRLKEDGSVPKDNPFVNTKGARPEIWSLGHRNPQGLFFDRGTSQLWEAEFGPMGGDEINLIAPGNNYGWPVVTFGAEYVSGKKIGEGTEKKGMTAPIHHWTPSISPSGLTGYSGELFPEWKDSLFLACLSGMQIRRVKLEKGKVVKEEALLSDKNWRFRSLRFGPEGALYFSTDEGVIGRITPDRVQ